MDFINKEPVLKGWSCDKKYCAVTVDGTKYFVRITPKEKGANRTLMFQMQQRVAELGISMCRPVEIGRCGENVYTVHTWIDGVDAKEVMQNISDQEQYAYGIESGRILKLIHSIESPDNIPDWETRFNAKMNRKIKMYRECPAVLCGAENMIEYIEKNRGLIKNRPQTFQHGDYHIGNMMIEDGRLVIIDFDRYDFGDPWEEFNRIVWCAQVSPMFASGMLDGYFDGDIPLNFWGLLMLYISSNMLGDIAWSASFSDEELNRSIAQAKDVLSWYDDMRSVVPLWYSGDGAHVV